METRRIRWTAEAVALLAAGTACLAIGAATLLDLPFAARSDGVVALALPWSGALAYAGMAFGVLRRPDDGRFAWGLAACLFVHAALVNEMARAGAICPSCVVVAILALVAAAARLARRPSDFALLTLGLLGGVLLGRMQPYERIERVATRWIWPARRLASLPPFVDRERLRSCEHPTRVRILVYEKDCKG